MVRVRFKIVVRIRIRVSVNRVGVGMVKIRVRVRFPLSIQWMGVGRNLSVKVGLLEALDHCFKLFKSKTKNGTTKFITS